MRLINIANIKFGYNIQYHQRFQRALERAEFDEQRKQRILKNERMHLQTEDTIVQLEQKGALKDSFVDTFVRAKISHVKDVARLTDSDDYRDALATQYTHELTNTPNITIAGIGWRTKLINALSECNLDVTDEDLLDDFGSISLDMDEDDGEVAPAPSSAPPNKTPNKEDEEEYEEEEPRYFEKYRYPTQKEIDEAKKAGLKIFSPEVGKTPRGFCDVIGLEDRKEEFQTQILDYLNDPELAELDRIEYGITQPKGFLFYGPQGCGKTYIAKALAVESGLMMYRMDVDTIGSRFVNQSANNIANAFGYLIDKAKQSDKPILLFMDEVDSIALDRKKYSSTHAENAKTTSTLLKYIEEAQNNNIIVICTTNVPEMVDSAFKDRLKIKYFGLPNDEQRQKLLFNTFSKVLKGQKLANDFEAIQRLSRQMDRYTNRTIDDIVRDSIYLARKNKRSDVQESHVMEVMKNNVYERVDESVFKKLSKKETVVGGFFN